MDFFGKLKKHLFSSSFLPFLFLGLLLIVNSVFCYLFEVDLPLKLISFLGLVLWLITSILAINLIDISSRLQLERTQINAMIRSIDDPAIAYSQNFEVILANPALEKLTNLKKEELIGKIITPEMANNQKFSLLVKIIFPSLAPAVLEQQLDTYPQKVKVKFFEPQELTLEIVTTKVIDEKGKVYGFLKVIHNLTREENLRKIQSDFITIAAHQLRTPLSGLNWILDVLSQNETGPLNETQKDLLEKAKAALSESIETVEDLLNAAQIEEGKFGFEFSLNDLEKIIETTLVKFEPIAEKNNIKLIFYRLKPPLNPIVIDPLRIKLVMEILIDNAIKYNVLNGEVRIKLEVLKDRPFVMVSVEDTGIGISEEEKEKVFTKFFRSQKVVKKETLGTGLGLYLAKNIIERHGGKIWFKSEENRGTTFYFTLPLDPSFIPPQ
ncbi:MAG TPA: ATP-binding protein [Candidatus Paceibacterota bacterium]|nr:ATP-binding protein [Candidatus Paceibacterota bacterium]